MKYCKQCKIHSRTNRALCPLCAAPLTAKDDRFDDPFPDIMPKPDKSRLVFRILFLISTVVSAICITVDIMLPPHPFFSVYVVAGLLCLWLGVIYTVTRNQNIIKNITTQVFLLCFIAVVWDFATKWKGWSVEYVIPIVCINALISIAVVARLLQYPITNYILYLFIHILFGITPIILLALNLIEMKYPALICVVGSIIALLVVLTFEGKNMMDELKRRFHL